MSLSLEQTPNRMFPLISSLSRWSLQGAGPALGTPVSTAWATANQARYVPFWVPERITVTKLLAYNGATAVGNTDIGLYDEFGAEVIAATAAAQAGTASWQEFDVTDTPIASGLYYLGLLSTSTTATFYAWSNKEVGRAAGVFSQAVGAATLPSPTATFAALDAGVIPIVGIATRVLI